MLKIIAIVLLLMDHSAIFLFPEYTFFLRSFGQAGWPLFCFFIVQGNKYTSDKLHYLINILFCACITEYFWRLIYPGSFYLNDLFTLLFSLVLIQLYEKHGYKVFALLIPLLFTGVINYYIAVVFIIYFLEDDFYFMSCAMIIFYSITSILTHSFYSFGGVLCLLLLWFPLPRLNLNKWFFYLFYPSQYFFFHLVHQWIKIH